MENLHECDNSSRWELLPSCCPESERDYQENRLSEALAAIQTAALDLGAAGQPYDRLRAADRLHEALRQYRSRVSAIRAVEVNILRDLGVSYGTMAADLGLSRARIQQLAKGLDNDDRWNGDHGG